MSVPVLSLSGEEAGAPVEQVDLFEQDDAERAKRWERAVGPVVIEAGPRMEPPQLDSLTVVSWNVAVGRGDLEGFIRRLVAGEFGDPTRRMVLLLQEVARTRTEGVLQVPEWDHQTMDGADRITPPDSADFLATMENLRSDWRGLYFCYAPSMRNGRSDREDRGNAIVSTFPLSEVRTFTLPWSRQRRVAVSAVVDIGVPVELCCVHLDTARFLDYSDSQREREAQVSELAMALGRGGPPQVLGGDFNTIQGTTEGLVKALRERHEFTQPSRLPVMVTHRWGVQLDFLMARGNGGTSFDYRVIPHRFGSDHHPLIGELTVKGALR